MNTYRYPRKVNGAVLMSEIQAAFPSTRPAVGTDGVRVPMLAISFSSDDDEEDYCEISIPESVTKAALDVVVNAHDLATPDALRVQLTADTSALTDFLQQSPAWLNRLQEIQTEMNDIATGQGAQPAAVRAQAAAIRDMVVGLRRLAAALSVVKRRQG